MSLDNATRCCRSILPNERVPLISVDDLLAGELKKCGTPCSPSYQMHRFHQIPIPKPKYYNDIE
jgi:hypothetical protein